MNSDPVIPDSFDSYKKDYCAFLDDLREASPTLAENCYLKGSAPASIQHFQHTFSMDADFETKDVFDIDTILTVRDELRAGLGDRISEFSYDGEYGVFMGAVDMGDGKMIEIDLMSSFSDVNQDKFSDDTKLQGFDCATKGDYVKSKAASCLRDRADPKDLIHLASACAQDPALHRFVEQGVDRISDNPYTAFALHSNLKDIQKQFSDGLEEPMLELLAPKEGKRVCSMEKAMEFGDSLIEIVGPKMERNVFEKDFSEEMEL